MHAEQAFNGLQLHYDFISYDEINAVLPPSLSALINDWQLDLGLEGDATKT